MTSPRITAAGFAFVDPVLGLFVVRRSARVSEPGTWGVPGGYREPGEEPLETALRECEEEIGIVPAHRILGIVQVPSRSGSYALYVAEVDAESLDAIDLDERENTDAGWASLDAPAPQDAHPGLRRAWRLLQQVVELVRST